jgi:hypothetical protein
VLVLKASAPESIGTSDWEQTVVANPSNTISASKTLFIYNPFLRQFKKVDPRKNRDLLAGPGAIENRPTIVRLSFLVRPIVTEKSTASHHAAAAITKPLIVMWHSPN